MSNPNEYIAEYLDEYIISNKPGFSVLISGSWGCGKTHCIDQYSRGLDEDIQKHFVRISLNGIGDTSEICSQILTQLCPSKVSKAAPLIGKLATGASKFFNVDGVITPKDMLALRKKNMADKILVIDDLERCCLPITETFGFLNGFIETHGLKVILLGYEEEIAPPAQPKEPATEAEAKPDKCGATDPSAEQIQYRRIREKVVGKAFTVEEHAEDVIPELIEKQHESIRTILQNNASALISIVKTSANDERKEYNYRALQHTLRDFHILTKKLNQEYLDQPDLMSDLLHTFCAIGYEIQLGKITASEISKLMDYYVCQLARHDKEKVEKINLLLERHSISTESLILGKELLTQLFENKAVLKEDLNQALANSVYFCQTKDRADYIRLWHWRDQEDDEATAIIQTVRKGLGTYEYTIPGEILHIFGSFLKLTENGAIPESKADIQTLAEGYIEHLVSNDLFTITVDGRDVDDLLHFGHGSLGYASENTEEFRAIGELLIEKGKEADRNRKVQELLDILEELETNPKEVCDRLTQGDLRAVDVLKEIDPKKFFEAFLKIKNQNKREVAFMLKHRYEHVRADYNYVLTNEHKFLTKLDELIEEHLSTAETFTPTMEQLKLTRDAYLSEAIKSTRPAEDPKRPETAEPADEPEAQEPEAGNE